MGGSLTDGGRRIAGCARNLWVGEQPAGLSALPSRWRSVTWSQQNLRNVDPERLRTPEVDDEFKLSRLFYWRIFGSRAFQRLGSGFHCSE